MSKKLYYSHHAIMRMAQRCLSPAEIEYIVRYGRRFHNAGVIHCFLAKKDIPEDDHKDDKFSRLEGATVLLDSKMGQVVITVYRNKEAPKKIRRKAKYNLRAQQGANFNGYPLPGSHSRFG